MNLQSLCPMPSLALTVRVTFVVAIAALGGLASAEEFRGKVVGVTDADTISVMRDSRAETVRLNGIDAPEDGQNRCRVGESNPHEPKGSADFKPAASPSSATPAWTHLARGTLRANTRRAGGNPTRADPRDGRNQRRLEAAGGFEPPDNGFADRRLNHLATPPFRELTSHRPPETGLCAILCANSPAVEGVWPTAGTIGGTGVASPSIIRV